MAADRPRPSLPLPAQSHGSETHAATLAGIPPIRSILSTPDIPDLPDGISRFNSIPPQATEALLLTCCGSRRWARRLTDHRPYPDLAALLAAADEAVYDMRPADIAEALANESAIPQLPSSALACPVARTALHAAHAAYESRFGHTFVICLDPARPGEHLDQMLTAIHARLGNEPEEERAIVAEELRGIARARIADLVHG